VKDSGLATNVARWMSRRDPTEEDPYRLFIVLARLCRPLPTKKGMTFHSGPSQKFVLRQIKAIDKATLEQREAHIDTRDVVTSQESSEKPRLSPVLLMLYGQMLMIGGSLTSALNYFFRAHAIDPNNPLVVLCIGISYLLRAIKRTALNRHFHILQGFSFLFRYYDMRYDSGVVVEQQEASFNIARAFHTIGTSYSIEKIVI
jgi:general transcription factor 3C polypeptide 3 (transcription factor C subunit 4)